LNKVTAKLSEVGELDGRKTSLGNRLSIMLKPKAKKEQK
jgi:hypothetical protein